jgi:hypothetical protein
MLTRRQFAATTPWLVAAPLAPPAWLHNHRYLTQCTLFACLNPHLYTSVGQQALLQRCLLS